MAASWRPAGQPARRGSHREGSLHVWRVRGAVPQLYAGQTTSGARTSHPRCADRPLFATSLRPVFFGTQLEANGRPRLDKGELETQGTQSLAWGPILC